MFHNMGAQVRTSRWFAYNDRFNKMRPCLTVLLMVALYMALVRGKLKCISDIPGLASLGNVVGFVAPVAKRDDDEGQAASSSDAPAVKRANVKDSNLQVDKMRRANGGSSLLMVIRVLANRAERRVATGIVELAEPIRELHGQQLVECKTKLGSIHWFSECASGMAENVLKQVWAKLTNPAFLSLLEMRKSGDILSDGMFMEDRLVAECVVDVARRLAFNEFLSDSFFTMRPFGRFAQACHDKAEVRVQLLPWCKQLFECIEGLEKASDDNPELQPILKAMLWLAHCWVREIMVAFAEAEWQCISPLVRRELMEVVSSQVLSSCGLPPSENRGFSL